MLAAEDFQKHMAPLFPGLMGIKILEASKDKIVASMRVRPDLCTSGGLCHGGAYMALADTLGAIGTVVNLPPNTRTTTIEIENQFPRCSRGRHGGDGRIGAAAPRPHHAGVADDHQVAGRQAVRRRHANANGPAVLKPRPHGHL